MWRIILSCIIGGTCLYECVAQKKHYRVENSYNSEKLCLTFTATSGTCYIKPSHSTHPIHIFGDPESSGITPAFNTSLKNGTQYVNFNLHENEPAGIGKRLSYKVFSKNEGVEENEWHVYLTGSKPLQLNLIYGIGNANVDLSGMTVQRLNINTGSADVNVGYLSGEINKTVMDTFYVKVDMGSLIVKQLNLTRAKEIIADVGFGNLKLDFSDRAFDKSNITASVGAGSLEITIPEMETPVLVYINNSPLCRVSFPSDFREIRKNVYANKMYKSKSGNVLTFDLDVAMGKISFITK